MLGERESSMQLHVFRIETNADPLDYLTAVLGSIWIDGQCLDESSAWPSDQSDQTQI
jgi:hypothetical protein